jgi:hypothetical protein
MHLSQVGTDSVTDLHLSLDPADIVHHPTLRHITLWRTKEPDYLHESLVYCGFAFPISHSGELPNHIYMNWTEAHFRRLELASEAVQKFGLYDKFKKIHPLWKMRDCLTARSRNRPSSETIFEPPYVGENLKWLDKLELTFSTFTGSFALAGLFYGSVHLLVWNRPFRGEIHELLWKMSSLTILMSGIPVVIGCFCFEMHEANMSQVLGWSRSMRNLVFIGVFLFGGISALFTLFYAFCRTFIIIECFLDVFHLPDSAFEVPKWSQYFPHVG